MAIGRREARIVLDREEQLWQRLLKAPAEQQCSANYIKYLAKPAAWAETQRSLGTLDRPIKLTGKKPENTGDIPATRETWVEQQRFRLIQKISSPLYCPARRYRHSLDAGAKAALVVQT